MELANQPDDALNQDGVLFLILAVNKEQPVDLECVDGQAFQQAERGIALPEIVNGTGKAFLLQLFHDFGHQLEVVAGDGFRKFKVQQTVRDPVTIFDGHIGGHKVRFVKLEPGNIHRDRQDGPLFVQPAAQGTADAFKDVLVQLGDKMVFFKNRDKPVGRNDPAVGFFPAHQSFRTGDGAGAQIHLGLIIDDEFPVVQGFLHLADKAFLLQQVVADAFVVEGIFGMGAVFDRLAREIGPVQNVVYDQVAGGVLQAADAAAYRQGLLVPGFVHEIRDVGVNGLLARKKPFFVLIAAQDYEIVRRDTAENLIFLEFLADNAGVFPEDRAAVFIAEHIVNVFKVGEISIGHGIARGFAGTDQLLGLALEAFQVIRARQGVPVRHVVQIFVQILQQEHFFAVGPENEQPGQQQKSRHEHDQAQEHGGFFVGEGLRGKDRLVRQVKIVFAGAQQGGGRGLVLPGGQDVLFQRSPEPLELG